MRRRQDSGFTIIELMITMVILVTVLGAASALFVNLMRAYKQQSKIAETGMEGIVGLEILRRDIEHAGFGLPWNSVNGSGEAENGAGTRAVACNPTAFTDAPRAIQSIDNAVNAGDYLVIRAANIGMTPASGKWTTLGFGPVHRTWGSPMEDLEAVDRVIVLSPGLDNTSFRTLVSGGGAWYTRFDTLGAFAPPDATQTYLVYGIDCATTLRMPFNRADYYIDRSSIPVHCAPDTGILVKATLRQSDGLLTPIYPLLDCVRSVRYRYRLDTNGDGLIDTTTVDADGIAGLTAQQIRDQVREVQVFILAHDGQRDTTYRQAPNPIDLGGRLVTVDNNYRWRLYRMVIQPISMRD